MKRQATDLSENICKTHIQQKINISNSVIKQSRQWREDMNRHFTEEHIQTANKT